MYACLYVHIRKMKTPKGPTVNMIKSYTPTHGEDAFQSKQTGLDKVG